MNRPLKIGFLMPYSGMYPFYGQHLVAGLTCALSRYHIRASQFQFIPAYVGNGERNKCLEEAKRLIFFENVDVLMGMVNVKILEDLKPILESFNKFGLFFDFGEYIPPPGAVSSHICCISARLWQSQYALGKWTAKEFGTNGQLVMPIYEAGFNLNASFMEGFARCGADGIHSFVLPQNYASSENLNLSSFFEALEESTPDFVHAIFSGKMANQFLWQWRQSKFYNQVPLVAVENMAYDEGLDDVDGLGISMYSARSWHRELKSRPNQEFVKQFENFGKQPANIFAMLGYEGGLCLSAIFPTLIKGNAADALSRLDAQGVEGPRGIIYNGEPQNQIFNPIDIVKVQTGGKQLTQTILAVGNAVAFDTGDVLENTHSGWLNPYISV